MKTVVVVSIVVVVIAGSFLYFGGAEWLGLPDLLNQSGAGTLTAAPGMVGDDEPGTGDPGMASIVRSGSMTIADAVVVPVDYAALSMPTSGIVDQLLAVEGETLAAGDLILRLQNLGRQAAVEEARSAYFKAQVQLEALRAGARPEEIAALQADVDAAQARLDSLTEAPRPEDVDSAQAQLASARAALSALYRGPESADETALKADLADAEARLRQARSAYNEVAWSPDIAKRPESLQLEEATNAYEAAQARYDALFAAPQSDEVASAQALVVQAQAELDRLTNAAMPSQIAEAEAELRRAQAQLAQSLAGTREEEIAAAAADVVKAKAQLLQAEAALAETELRAPFDGTVAFLDVRVGEQVTAGAVIVQLADLTRWQIETSDLTEIGIVDVEEGDRADLTFDAIDDLDMAGAVTRIRPIGENKQGDVVYTVIIEPDRQDERLRWNMTAVVRIGDE